MPVVQDEDGIEEDIGRLRTATSSTSTNFVCQEQFLAAVSMASLQLQDRDIGPILKVRIWQTNQLRREEVLSKPDAVKILWSQWHCLAVKEWSSITKNVYQGRLSYGTTAGHPDSKTNRVHNILSPRDDRGQRDRHPANGARS